MPLYLNGQMNRRITLETYTVVTGKQLSLTPTHQEMVHFINMKSIVQDCVVALLREHCI